MDKINEFFANFAEKKELIELLFPFLKALIFFVVGHYLAKLIAKLVRKLMQRKNSAELFADFIAQMTYAVAFSIALVAGLETLGLNISSILAVLGAMGLAIGLALKDSLSNYAAGIIISVLGPFRTGDFVEVAGLTGTVTDVSLFSTILTTTDNKLVTIPNNSILSEPITNYTAKNTRRVDITIGVSYNDDLRLVRGILTDILESHPLILKDPAASVLLLDLADSSVNFACRPWVDKENYWSVRDDLLVSIKTKLEAAGCSIPYPQQDVHLHTISSAGDATKTA